MNFNFYDEYKGYSTSDLLKIVNQPGDYQPAAIEAATLILKERQVSQQDVQAVTEHFETIALQKHARSEKITSYKNKVADFLEAILRPGTEVNSVKWINIILVILPIQFIWQAFAAWEQIYRLFSHGGHEFDYLMCLIQVIQLVFIAIVFYLLLKKKRWGWILLFVDNFGSLIYGLYNLISYSGYDYLYFGNSLDSLIIGLLIKSLIVVFLWRKDISDYFQVSAKAKRNTVLITPLICVLFHIILILLLG